MSKLVAPRQSAAGRFRQTCRKENRMKSKAWYVHFPCDAYAIGPFRFDKEVTEREARAKAREWSGYTRLPRDTSVWATDD